MIYLRRRFLNRFLIALLVGICAALLLSSPLPVKADVNLTIEEITWSIIGLDSNDVNDGPNEYPVGVRVCNTGSDPSGPLTATFAWVTTSPYINLVNSNPIQSFPALGPGACQEIFYAVSITRDTDAYDETADYSITVSDGTNTVVEGQQLYVEHLISQNRNSTNSITGPTTVVVGNTYTWVVDAATATNGYEEIEHFLTFCPDIYRLDSVETHYSRPNPPGLAFTYDKFWGDGCAWDTTNNTGCTITGVKYGGNTITYEYHVTIVGEGTCVLQDMVYDFSGSSFHYNSDYPDVSLTITAVGSADLSIEKVASTSVANVGDPITFTVTLTNGGPSTATNVDVTDVIPAGVTLGTVTPGTPDMGSPVSTWNGASNLWEIPQLVSGETVTLTISGTLNAAGTVTNTAEVTASDQFDVDSTPDNQDPAEDDQDSASVTVNAVADLSLTKVISGTPPTNLGDPITYEVTLTNGGPSTATNVDVTDVIPAGVTLGTVTPGTPDMGSPVSTWNGASNLWEIPQLVSGETVTLTISGTVNTTGGITNTAEVTASDQLDPDSTPNNHVPTEDDQDSVSVTIAPAADLELSKSVVPTTATIGDPVTYTVTLINNGPDTATNIDVTDALPPSGFTLGTATPGTPDMGSPVSTWNGASNLWEIPQLVSGESVTLTLAGTVTATGSITNTAEVTASDQYDPDSTPNNGDPAEDDLASATVVVGGTAADLRLLKEAQTPGPLNVGDTITFLVTLTNDGPDTANNIDVADVVPSGISGVTVTPSAGTTYAAGLWEISSLASGASATLTISGTVDISASDSTISNTAEVTAVDETDPDSTPNNHNPGEDDQDSASVSINPTADLELTKAVTVEPTYLGDTATFVVTLTNNGPDTATNITVNDSLPGGLSGVTVTPSGSTTWNGVSTWSIPSLANGESATLTISGTTTLTGDITNMARVMTVDQYDPDSTPGNNVPAEDDQDSATATVEPAADLHLSKSVDPPSAGLHDPVTYTVTITNDGPDPATGIEVVDALPSPLAFSVTSVTPSGLTTWDDGTATWTIPSLGVGASETLTIAGTVENTGLITNTAEVTASDQYDPDSTPNNGDPSEDDLASATVSVNQPSADLSLLKEVISSNPAPAEYGGTVDFRVTVSNAGPDDATGVVIEDILPAGLSNLTVLSITEGSYNGSTWGTLTIPAGGSDVLEFRATIQSTGTITNTAQVDSAEQPDPDSTPGNNNPAEDDQDSASIAIGETADLELLKSVSPAPPAVVTVGDTVTYTLTLTNNGPDTATNVVVTDTLPAGVTYLGNVSLPAGTTFDGTTWDVGTLPVGTIVLIFNVQVDAPGEQVNTAEVTASDQYDPDSTPNNGVFGEDDLDRATFNASQADLELVKTVDNPTPNVGDIVEFTLTVTNNGPDDATDVVAVTDKLPPGLQYDSHSMTNCVAVSPIDCTYDPNTGVWSIGTVTTTTPVSLALRALVLPPSGTPGEYVNYAEVSSSDQYDPDSTPNDGSNGDDDDSTVTVAPQMADLVLIKTVNNSSPKVGQDFTFTITLTNNGPNDATNVTVSDPLPAGIEYQSSSATRGTYSPATGIWDVGDLANGETVVLQITARLTANGTYENVAEVESSAQWDPTSIPANGSLTEDDLDSVTVSTAANPKKPKPSVAQPVVQLGDPALSKVGSPEAATAGETVTWTATISNPGSVPTNPFTFTDTIPSQFTVVNVTTTRGEAVVDGNKVTVEVGVLQPNDVVTVVIETVANESALPGEVCNIAIAGNTMAEDCITLFPEELPPTGGQPVRSLSWLWWVAAGLGVMALAGAYALKRGLVW